MSTGSDTDEFYDAEDIAPSPSKLARKTKGSASQFENVFVLNAALMDQSEFTGNVEELTEACSKCDSKDNDEIFTEPSFLNLKPAGRRRFRELRQSMQNDEDEVGPTSTSTPESQGSSVEGIFPSARTTHPFRIIEHDAISLQSMTSLGRVGRILGGTIDPSSISVSRDSNIIPTTSGITTSHKVSETPKSNDVMPMASPPTTVEKITVDYRPTLQEPDVIASTKTHLNKNIDKPKIPIAPPRRKKKISTSHAELEIEKSQKYEESETITRLEGKIDTTNYNNMISHGQGTVLHNPVNTIETMTQQFEHSLDVANSNNNILTPTNSIIALNSNVSANGNNASPPLTEKARSTNSSRSSTATRSLDLRMATKGQYVVKPQDEDRSKAEGPSSEELERLELLKFELLHSRSGGPSNSGHSSLGPTFKAYYSPRNSKERRKSAGDEELLKQLNMFVRTRTDSGKQLTDMEILEQVTVLNLDTGERVPLSIAEDKLPQCINPLSLHIMRLTSEYISTGNLNKQAESDEESVGAPSTDLGAGEGETEGEEGSRLRRRTTRLKRFLGSTVKKTMDKAKSIAAEVSHARHREDVADIDDVNSPGELNIKLKASSSHKGPYEFDSLQHVQDLSEQHVGPVWCMKFSACGRLLATAGQDRVLRVWVLRDAYVYFQDMRTKYNADQKVSPTPSQESLVSQQSSEELGSLDGAGPFMSRPFCTYTGHTSDLLDVSWSKNHFVLSSSMDKTVRLWHISRKECLCCFQHIDFVTAIVFHPRDDRYFLSGSLDGKLRLWNIPDKKVAVWNEVDGQAKLITAANFCQNGKFAVVGTYDGRCIFYTTDQLKYHTQIHVRSTRGKNATGRKISGIEPMPGEDKILITSNDSRIRLYDLRDLNLSCKYKGYMNVSSQIKASFSHDGKYIVSGSENQCIYIWKTHHDYSKFSSVRRDRNDFWEGIKAHNAVVTCAVFAPSPDNIIKIVEERDESNNEPSGSQSYLTHPEATDPMVEQRTKGCGGHVLVSADFTGCIKVFINKTKPKHSSLPASALA